MTRLKSITANTWLLSVLFALPIGAVGCRTTGVDAHSMPPAYRAQPVAGSLRPNLRGFSSANASSTAIGAGDLLAVDVRSGLGSDEGTGAQLVRVDARGIVIAPLIGEVNVVGVEPDVAAQRIAAAAIQRDIYRRPDVTVRVEEQATNRITVLGAVREPGVHETPRHASDVVTAIAAAGGFEEEAGVIVEVTRRGIDGGYASTDGVSGESGEIQLASFTSPSGGRSSRLRFDVADLSRRSPNDLRLGDGDVVFVPPKPKRLVHVTGLVKSPNQFEMPEDYDLRVLDAVAMAGGVTTHVADKAIVVRQTADGGEPLVINLSLGRAERDGTENVLLQSGDLVRVEPTVATTIVETASQLFRISMGIGGNLTLF